MLEDGLEEVEKLITTEKEEKRESMKSTDAA